MPVVRHQHVATEEKPKPSPGFVHGRRYMPVLVRFQVFARAVKIRCDKKDSVRKQKTVNARHESILYTKTCDSVAHSNRFAPWAR